MPLPQAVRSASEAAEQEWASQYGEATVVNAPDELAGLDALVQQTTQAQKENVSEEPTAQAPVQGSTQDAPPQDSQPAPEAQPEQPDPWEHRYRVLQGKYDSEVPRLQQELKSTLAASTALQQQVGQMQEQLNQFQREQAEAKHVASLALTDEEKAAFGDDLVNLTRRIAQAEAQRVREELSGKLSATEQTVQQASKDAEQAAYDRFLATVERQVPDWEAVNKRTDWLQWLGQTDPLLGSTRQEALDAAAGARDAARVAAIFGAFKATLPASADAPVDQPTAPRTQAAAPSQTGGTKRTYTEADIATLYAARRRGEFPDAQWAAISAEIDAAVAEGRIR